MAARAQSVEDSVRIGSNFMKALFLFGKCDLTDLFDALDLSCFSEICDAVKDFFAMLESIVHSYSRFTNSRFLDNFCGKSGLIANA